MYQFVSKTKHLPTPPQPPLVSIETRMKPSLQPHLNRLCCFQYYYNSITPCYDNIMITIAAMNGKGGCAKSSTLLILRALLISKGISVAYRSNDPLSPVIEAPKEPEVLLLDSAGVLGHSRKDEAMLLNADVILIPIKSSDPWSLQGAHHVMKTRSDGVIIVAAMATPEETQALQEGMKVPVKRIRTSTAIQRMLFTGENPFIYSSTEMKRLKRAYTGIKQDTEELWQAIQTI